MAAPTRRHRITRYGVSRSWQVWAHSSTSLCRPHQFMAGPVSVYHFAYSRSPSGGWINQLSVTSKWRTSQLIYFHGRPGNAAPDRSLSCPPLPQLVSAKGMQDTGHQPVSNCNLCFVLSHWHSVAGNTWTLWPTGLLAAHMRTSAADARP